MASPFPGMNPYLENPESWPEVHSRLIVAIADALNPQILPKYRVAIEQRIYTLDSSEALLVGIPDVTVATRPTSTAPPVAVLAPPATPIQVRVPMPLEIRESYLQVRDRAKGDVVTVLEVLSPSNKRPGPGRTAYTEKRRQVLASATHLVELDLLRHGDPMALQSGHVSSHYRILVSRGDQRPQADLYAFNLPQPLPSFPLPLKGNDPEPLVNGQALLNQVYDRAGYGVVIDYDSMPVPPLSEADWAWVRSWWRANKAQ